MAPHQGARRVHVRRTGLHHRRSRSSPVSRVEDLKAGRTPADEHPSQSWRARSSEDARCAARLGRSCWRRPGIGRSTAAGWLFELKLDGYRVSRPGARIAVAPLPQRQRSLGIVFPEVIQAVEALPFEPVVLDGEVVATDEAGRPRFPAAAAAGQLRRPLDIRHAVVENPVTFYAFDLLGFERLRSRGRCRSAKRKALLQRVLPRDGADPLSGSLRAEGEVLYEQVQKLGLEGIVAKRADAPYQAGPIGHLAQDPDSPDRRLRRRGVHRAQRIAERPRCAAPWPVCRRPADLSPAGRGVDSPRSSWSKVRKNSTSLRRVSRPAGARSPRTTGRSWVEPRLVCEVEYTEWTEEGLLRQPVFLRFRDDKTAGRMRGRCGEAGRRGSGEAARPAQRRQRTQPCEGAERSDGNSRNSNFTNLKKVFWPEEGTPRAT